MNDLRPNAEDPAATPGQPGRLRPWFAVAIVVLFACAIAAFTLTGTTSAATVNVEAGNDWFCSSDYQGGICETQVAVGDTVNWQVIQGMHNVAECDDSFSVCGVDYGGFRSDDFMGQGESYAHTFTSPGTYEYLCELHAAQMRGRVIVSAATATPSPTVTASPSPSLSPSPTPVPPYDVQMVKDLGVTKLSGIAMVPQAPHHAVVITQDGDLWKIDFSDPAAAKTAFGNVRDRMTRQSDEGLLGIAFDPIVPGRVYTNFTTGTNYYQPYNNGPVFPTPTMPANPKRNRIARYEITDGVMDMPSEEVIYESLRPSYWHTLNQIVFGSDNNLYAGSGDGGGGGAQHDPDGGQGVGNDLATVIRVDPNENGPGYTIPAGNPFDDGAGPNADQVWAYGLRNSWRISFDRSTQEMWGGDVGQWYWEEVNHIEAGRNYGWVIMEGNGCAVTNPCTPPPNHTGPRTAYCNYACDDCAVIGGYVYRGQGMPELDGWYIYADFCSGRIRAVDTESGAAAIELADTTLQPASFGESPDGELYVVDYNGKVYLLTHGGDTDGDGDLDASDNCLAVYNPAQTNSDADSLGDECDTGDADGDGYADRDEALYIGTGALDPCGADGWPSELDSAGASANRLDIHDLVSFLAPVRRLDSSPGDAAFDPRWDVVPGSGGVGSQVNIQDLIALIQGPTGYPPMLGGARALNQSCPSPP